MERAEQHVEERGVGGVVFVQRLGVRRVVPVVELRRDDEVAEPANVHLDVGMNQHRLHADENQISENRVLRKPNRKIGTRTIERVTRGSRKCRREPESQSIAVGEWWMAWMRQRNGIS